MEVASMTKYRATSISLILTLFLATTLTVSYAGNSSRFVVPGNTSISTATFKMYPIDTFTAANPGAPITLLNSASKQFFFVKNGGTLQATAFTLVISSTVATTIALTRCAINVEFTANNTCASGSQVVVYGNTNAPVTTLITLTIPVGSWYHFQLTPGKKTVPTASVTISSTQITHTGVTNS